MQRLYSTVSDQEQAEGLGRILGLVRAPAGLLAEPPDSTSASPPKGAA
jgi:hypothetical protein